MIKEHNQEKMSDGANHAVNPVKGKLYRISLTARDINGLFKNPWVPYTMDDKMNQTVAKIPNGSVVIFLECAWSQWKKVVFGEYVGWTLGDLWAQEELESKAEVIHE